LRLGLFPNITHATALVGVHEGIFQQHLGSAATLSTSSFTAGGKAIEALFAGAIDASYVGPNPAINGWAKSKGKALRIVSGATSGGAALVVKAGVTSAAQLKGSKLASPALGNTQDVALRTWLQQNGLHTDESGGGDVSILPQENAQTLDAFKSGAIDGAWVPEPWATRLVNEGNGSVLVDERSLWPNGKFVTTHLVVAASFLEAHPAVVSQLLAGQIAANDLIATDPAKAQAAANAQIEQITQKRLADSVITAAWGHLEFTNDPIASSLRTSADHAIAIGLLDPVDLTGIYALDPLNSLLTAAGRPTVAGA
jgi:NitT/TauT family transport system substrate-binding protein